MLTANSNNNKIVFRKKLIIFYFKFPLSNIFLKVFFTFNN